MRCLEGGFGEMEVENEIPGDNDLDGSEVLKKQKSGLIQIQSI